MGATTTTTTPTLVSLLPRRILKRWKTSILLLLMAGLLWLAFLVSDKRDNGQRRALEHTNSQPLKLANAKKQDFDFAHDDRGFESDSGGVAAGRFFDDEIDFVPLARSRSAPVVHGMKDPQQQNEEDNAAREEVDVVKEPESPKVDDNAALEEHSAEILKPGTVNKPLVMVSDNVVKEVPLVGVGHDKKIGVETKKISEKVQVVEDIREQEESFHQLPEHQKDPPEEKYGSYNNWRNLTRSEIGKLSVLGRRLFLNEKVGQEQNRTFTIHVWKYMKYVEKRLLFRYGKEAVDPFEECSVINCKITSKDDQVTEADAVLFHLHRIDRPPATVPRKKEQLWVWMSDESPYNIFMAAKDRHLEHYNGHFNWSMTYRIDSDVPVPYGRTIPLPKDQYLEKVDSFYNVKEKDIAILGSNCGGKNNRYKYIRELQKYIPVDIYGGCGTLKCEGHFKKDCPKLDEYKFYLAFENSNCDDYITEKVWWNALQKGAVPVVMGANKENYMRILPPGSFIFAEDFNTPEQLAEYLKYVLENPKLYEEYHSWRRRYRVLNEHGYFQSPVHHFCRLCEALNYNDRPPGGATADVMPYFDTSQHCYPSTWKPS